MHPAMANGLSVKLAKGPAVDANVRLPDTITLGLNIHPIPTRAGERCYQPPMGGYIAMTNIAYSYLRFSTPEQANGDCRRRQLAMAEKYAAEHHLKLDKHLSFRDLGVSVLAAVRFRG